MYMCVRIYIYTHHIYVYTLSVYMYMTQSQLVCIYTLFLHLLFQFYEIVK